MPTTADAESPLQQIEMRHATLVGDESLAIDHRLEGIESRDRLDDRRELDCPVMQVAGEDANLAVVEIDADAVAIPFDLVKPVRSPRDLVDQVDASAG